MNDLYDTGSLFSAVYPNPATSYFSIDYYSEVDDLIVMQLCDVLGNLIRDEKMEIGKGTTTLKSNVSDLAKGLYFFTVTMKGGNTYATKLLKE